MTQHAAVHPSEQRPPSPPPHRSPCASYFEPALTTVDTQESADSSSHGSSARLSVASDLSSSLRSRFSLSGFRSYRLNHRRSTSPSRKNTVSWRPDPPERTIITPPGDDDTGEDQANGASQLQFSLHSPQFHRSRNSIHPPSTVYPALLSRLADEIRHKITLSDNYRNGIVYRNSFTGHDLVDLITRIIGSTDRELAVRAGRALGRQRMFHDVLYEKKLIDLSTEIYQLSNRLLLLDADTASSPAATTNTTSSSMDGTNDAASELPCGVYTPLTHCYSPTCMLSPVSCYCYDCPKRAAEERRRRQESLHSPLERTSSAGTSLQSHRSVRRWVETVEPEVYESLPSREVERQEKIYELIYTEENFVDELEYVRDHWMEPLRDNDYIPEQKRKAFIDFVFATIPQIHAVNSTLIIAFYSRQREDPVVRQIGDIMLNYVDRFDPFIQYGAAYYGSKHVLDYERVHNQAFNDFVISNEKHPLARRLPLTGHLSAPTTRLGRYNLLLEQILKYTEEGNPDRETIPIVMDRIQELLTRMNEETGEAKNALDLQRIHMHLTFKNEADYVDMHLMDPRRKIIKQDILRYASHTHSTEFNVVLLDNYLFVAKVRVINTLPHYTVQRRPIPIQLLGVSTIEPRRRSRRSTSTIAHYIPGGHVASMGAHLPMRTSTDSGTMGVTGQNIDANADDGSSAGYPIVFQHLGRHSSGSFTLYTSSKPMRRPWIECIQKLVASYDREHAVLRMLPAIRRHEFFIDNPVRHITTFNNGRQFVMAAALGVYVGHTVDESMPRMVLRIDHVQQVDVLEDAQKLLVLAEKTLWEYALGVVNGQPEDNPPRNKVETHVPFFHVNHYHGRVMVVVPRDTRFVGAMRTSITVYEARHLDEYNARQPLHPQRHHLLDRNHGNPAAVRLMSPLDVRMHRYRQYNIPSQVFSIELSNKYLFVTTTRHVNMLDLSLSRTDAIRSLLRHDDPELAMITGREADDRPKRVAMFRTPQGEHLVCYDEYAFYIDGEGRRSKPEFLIVWEGTPTSYAFLYPYVLAFDSNFIEVRDIFTGERVQIIRGQNIHSLTMSYTYRDRVYQMFGVMTDPEKDTYQYIFRLELIRPDAAVPAVALIPPV